LFVDIGRLEEQFSSVSLLSEHEARHHGPMEVM
jgi:hypothetical protein